MTPTWLAATPASTPVEFEAKAYPSLAHLLASSYARHARRPAYRFLGKSYSFETIEHSSNALAAWLQSRGLKRGDRVAVMMPNVPQMPVAVAAILRACCVVVPIDPLLSGPELEFQLRDSGAKSVVLFEHCAAAVQAALPRLPQLKMNRIIIAAMGDMLGPFKGSLVNYVQRSKRHAVAPYELPTAVRFNDAISQGQPLPLKTAPPDHDDLALLQYTDGSHGSRKGAVLLHRNLVASVLQAEAWFKSALLEDSGGTLQTTAVCALPMHSVFGFNLGLLLAPFMGVCSILVSHAADMTGLQRELADERFQWLLADQHLFNTWAQHAEARELDWSALSLSLSTGSPVAPETAQMWRAMTGCPITQAYGLCETGSHVACMPLEGSGSGTGSLHPLPKSELVILDTQGCRLPDGTAGEIAVRGPQVMAGYWQRPEETARVMTAEGYLRTGDWGVLDAAGGLTIVDPGCDRIRRDEGLLLWQEQR